MEKEDKVARVLFLYDRLNEGEVLNKYELANEFGVNERSIQRDIDDIRLYLAERCTGEEVVYDHTKRGYYKTATFEGKLSSIELLVIAKILLDSRAFTKSEMQGLIQSILIQASEADRKAIKDIINNEVHHYTPVSHNKSLLKMIWDICYSIRQQQIIEISYERMDGKESLRNVRPVSVLFSEYYFYLVAYIENSEHSRPAFFRIDRIKSFKFIGDRFSISEKERFESGELRKRTQFMYSGELMTIKFRFYGPSLSAVLDKFPTAVVKNEMENGWEIEAEVYGKGFLMWILSQGEHVEVISPRSIRDELARKIQLMNEIYIK